MSESSSRDSSLSRLPEPVQDDEELLAMVSDAVEQKVGSVVGEALKPFMEAMGQITKRQNEFATLVAAKDQASPALASSDEKVSLMGQIRQACEAGLTNGESRGAVSSNTGPKAVEFRPKRVQRPPNLQKFYSAPGDEQDREDEGEALDAVPDRIAPHVLRELGRHPSAVYWVQAQSSWDGRSRKEALQWAALVDAFQEENLPLDSVVLEIVLEAPICGEL